MASRKSSLTALSFDRGSQEPDNIILVKDNGLPANLTSTCGAGGLPMSALGQKQTLQHVRAMSALPPKADIGTQPRNVRFVPIADIKAPPSSCSLKRTGSPRGELSVAY